MLDLTLNPYRATKRSADTLNLTMEKRLEFRLAGDGTVAPFSRRWRTVGGHVGWHEALLRYANLFLDAGMIDYERPAGREVDEFHTDLLAWKPVFVTRAGNYLFDTWRNRPFLVVEDGERDEKR